MFHLRNDNSYALMRIPLCEIHSEIFQPIPGSVEDEPTTVATRGSDAKTVIRRLLDMLFTPLSHVWGLKYHALLMQHCSRSHPSLSSSSKGC